eukprot:19406-Eustigmatos_ZCMA.PRE.1
MRSVLCAEAKHSACTGCYCCLKPVSRYMRAFSIGASVLGQQNMSFDALEQALDKCSGNFKR